MRLQSPGGAFRLFFYEKKGCSFLFDPTPGNKCLGLIGICRAVLRQNEESGAEKICCVEIISCRKLVCCIRPCSASSNK